MTMLFLASYKVLPSVLLPAYDLAVALRNRAQPLIGGFQTPLEKECLDILLRGSVPITICPARVFDPTTGWLYTGKLRVAVERGVADGRVTIVEPPGMVGDRPNAANAARRNLYLLDHCDEVLLLYATLGGKTDRLVREALDRGLSVSVLDHPANASWVELGATVWGMSDAAKKG
jgi:hypothetical protein